MEEKWYLPDSNYLRSLYDRKVITAEEFIEALFASTEADRKRREIVKDKEKLFGKSNPLDVFSALVSAHIYLDRGPIYGHNIEIFNIISDDPGFDIFDSVDSALLKSIKVPITKDSYFFTAWVNARFVEHQYLEGSEYDTEYEVIEIKTLQELKKYVV